MRTGVAGAAIATPLAHDRCAGRATLNEGDVMKKKLSFLVILGTAALAACGGPDAADNENSATAPAQSGNGSVEAGPAGAAEPAGEVYSGTGDITDISGNKVTISHGPIAGIGWPAMTMAFSAGSPEMLQGLNVGDPVSFQFQKAGSDYVIASINKAQ